MFVVVTIAGTLSGDYPSIDIHLASLSGRFADNIITITKGTFIQSKKIGNTNDLNLAIAWNATLSREQISYSFDGDKVVTVKNNLGVSVDLVVANALASLYQWLDL